MVSCVILIMNTGDSLSLQSFSQDIEPIYNAAVGAAAAKGGPVYTTAAPPQTQTMTQQY